jgi:hypothetical protein
MTDVDHSNKWIIAKMSPQNSQRGQFMGEIVDGVVDID